jgi:hypothetical protein
LPDSALFFAADIGGTDPAAFAGHARFFGSCAAPSIPAIALPQFDKLHCSNAPAGGPAESGSHILSANIAGFAVGACSAFFAD